MKTWVIFFFVFFYVTTSLFPANTDDDILGIVLSIKGNLIHSRQGKDEEIKPTTKIYPDSVIKLKQGEKLGKLQIGTADGPVTFKRFPVTFKKLTVVTLSDDQQKNYLASIGGFVLRGNQTNMVNSSPCMAWEINPLVLDENLIQQGFTLVISAGTSSVDTLTLKPLVFKCVDKIDPGAITYKLYNLETMEAVSEGKFKRTEKDFSLVFKEMALEPSIDYLLRAIIKSGTETTTWDLDFTVLSEMEISLIEEEIKQTINDTMNDFDKTIIRAGKYQYYNFKLRALSLLHEAGVDLDGLL
ncbi:MAG: hypothetical protein JW969_02715 [Spirochaetales bacterium]|nr:hypothetical protein [Spirochaetales bacterium]